MQKVAVSASLRLHMTEQDHTPKSDKNKPLTLLHKQINREIGKRRIRIEHVNGKLKTFRILAERYRNRRKRMGLRLNLIAAIYNMELIKK